MEGSRRAIVVGSSLAGLLAARVLADFYDGVLVLERDAVPDDGAHRRGVPQSRHAHALLAGGLAAIESLLPGFTAELEAAGSERADTARDVGWFCEGGWLRRSSSGVPGYGIGRARLESIVRARVAAVPNVRFRYGAAVDDLVASGDRTRVTGVRVASETIAAGLVVDACGRASLGPRRLAALGYAPPAEERIAIDLRYASRAFRPARSRIAGGLAACVASSPATLRGGGAFAQEDGTMLVTLFSHFGEPAPADLEGFRAFAASLEDPVIARELRGAEPVGEAHAYRVPASTRRRYERLARFPAGYLAIGDALAGFNPLYGQGMSVAALEAVALRDALRGGERRLARRYFARTARIVGAAWSVAETSDLRMRAATGRRDLAWRIRAAYARLVLLAAHDDAVCARAFLRVTNMLAPPSSLAAPALAARVACAAAARAAGRTARLAGAATRARRQADAARIAATSRTKPGISSPTATDVERSSRGGVPAR